MPYSTKQVFISRDQISMTLCGLCNPDMKPIKDRLQKLIFSVIKVFIRLYLKVYQCTLNKEV